MMGERRYPGFSQHRDERVRARINREHKLRVMRKIRRARRAGGGRS